MCPPLLFLRVKVCILPRRRKQKDILDADTDRFAAQIGPRNLQCKLANVTLDDVQGQMQLVQRFLSKLKIP
jgi:hypothetical protein